MARVMCKFCSNSLADVRHLVCECKAMCSHELRRFQRVTRQAASGLLVTIIDELRNIANRVSIQQTDVADGIAYAVDEFEQAASTIEWVSRDGRFLLHRLLLVLPFAPHELDQQVMPVSHRFAQMLHKATVLRYHSRRLFTKWASWSSRTLNELASIWRSHDADA